LADAGTTNEAPDFDPPNPRTETNVTKPNKRSDPISTATRPASGDKTCSEKLGLGDHEFVPWHMGIVS
jgi:altronate dehydratase